MVNSATDSIDILLEDIYRTAIELVALSERATELSNAQLVGLATMARSLSHFRALRGLSRDEHIVEARTIVRSAIENLFLLATLTKDSETLLAEMEEEDIERRKARGEFLLSRSILDADESRARLREVLATLKKLLTGRRRDLEPKRLAHRGDVLDAYAAHSEMSADSAHATLSSLSRYGPNGEAGFTIDFTPPLDRDEVFVSKVYLSMALLASTVALGEVLSIGFGDTRLEELWERHKAISKK
jgi:hypothetical protein